jgi:hypothetical protein
MVRQAGALVLIHAIDDLAEIGFENAVDFLVIQTFMVVQMVDLPNKGLRFVLLLFGHACPPSAKNA